MFSFSRADILIKAFAAINPIHSNGEGDEHCLVCDASRGSYGFPFPLTHEKSCAWVDAVAMVKEMDAETKKKVKPDERCPECKEKIESEIGPHCVTCGRTSKISTKKGKSRANKKR